MERRTPLSIFLLGILALFITGCSPSRYNHTDYCEDRDVIFCEDFEKLSFGVYVESLDPIGGSDWYMSDQKRLEGSFYDLPLEGRSQVYLGTIGNSENYYQDDTNTILFTDLIDLTGASSANLFYNILYITEEHWDGLIVVATEDLGASWIILQPKGGYPDTIQFDGSIIPGYSGINPFWAHEEIDLFPVLGSEIVLGFYFSSDFSITEWGIALDDIVVDADTQAKASRDNRIQTFSEVNLVLPGDPLISTEIPQAITFVDTPCEGEESEVLKESQRAFVKAVNETGNRFFVLHPESGNFCWVGQEDVWIDNNDYDLPQLSDKKPEDLYLPVCALSRTPNLDDPACFSGIEAAGEDITGLPYHLQSAIVENGKIIIAIIDPGGVAGRDLDPSIYLKRNEKDGYKVKDRNSSGGMLEVYINDYQQSCSLDGKNPGRVICDDLSLDAAGPLQVEICWQGWDESSRCPPGFGVNLTGEGCTILPVSDSCIPECPEGYLFSPGDGLCLIINKLLDEDQAVELCPDGFLVNPEAGCCVSSAAVGQSDCPGGYYYSPDTSSCLRVPNDGVCPEGYFSQAEPAACIPKAGNVPPVCAAFIVNFLRPEVTVRESTRCWKGPGSNFEIVSSLKPFTVVEVLGIGEIGEYLVINNPDYQVPCWANRDDFYLDKLDQAILPVIPVSSEEDQSSQDN